MRANIAATIVFLTFARPATGLSQTDSLSHDIKDTSTLESKYLRLSLGLGANGTLFQKDGSGLALSLTAGYQYYHSFFNFSFMYSSGARAYLKPNNEINDWALLYGFILASKDADLSVSSGVSLGFSRFRTNNLLNRDQLTEYYEVKTSFLIGIPIFIQGLLIPDTTSHFGIGASYYVDFTNRFISQIFSVVLQYNFNLQTQSGEFLPLPPKRYGE